MNAKTFIKIFLLSSSLILAFNCKNLIKSSADQPTEDYNLLALVSPNSVNGYYWDGLLEYSLCSSQNNNITSCLVYQENYNNIINLIDKNIFLNVDFLQNSGQLTIEIANPDTYLPLKFHVPVNVNVTIGPETGNGYAKILNLSNSNSITVDQITITLLDFKADVLQDGLRGSLSVRIQGQNDTLNTTFSFNIKKVY